MIALCSRCFRPIGDGWEEGWPNYGKILIGSCSVMSSKLMDGGLDTNDINPFVKRLIETEGHPLVTDFGYQELTLSWHNDGPYRMCWYCQYELIKVLGTFFFVNRPVPKKQPMCGD